MSTFQLLTLMAMMMPEEELIEKLESSIEQYKLIKTEDSKREFIMNLQLISLKLMNDVSGKGDLIEAMRHSQKIEKVSEIARNMIDPDESRN